MPYTIIAYVISAVLLMLTLYLVMVRLYAIGASRSIGPLLLNPPFSRATIWLLRRYAGKGKTSWDTAIDVALKTRNLSIIHLNAYHQSCPSEEIIKRLRDMGLYETITLLYSRGCKISEELKREALRFHILAGQKNYLEVYGFRQPRPTLISFYCGDRVIELWDGERTITSKGLPDNAFKRLQTLVNPDLASMALGAGIAISWGCTGGVNARHILKTIYPEIPSSISALSYHLGLTGSKAEIVGRATIQAFKIAYEIGGHQELGLPDWISSITVSPGVECMIEPGTIVVTDTPRAACPTWSPYRIALDGDKPSNLSVEAWIALKSLAYRRACYKSVLSTDQGDPLLQELRQVIPSFLKEGSDPPAEGGFQVHVSDVKYLRVSKYQVLFDCARPVKQCAAMAGLKPPEAITVKPKVASSSPVLRGPVEAIEVARELWGGGPTLYVTPSMLASKLAGSGLGLYIISEPEDVDEWLDNGSDAVTSWSALLDMPWLKTLAPRIVLVYPETFPGKPVNVGDIVDWVRMLATDVSSLMVSRLAYFQDSVLVGEARVPRVSSPIYDKNDLSVEAEEVFSEYWKGYKLRSYQKSIIKAILEMIINRPVQPVYTILPTGSGKSAIFQIAGIIGKRLGYGGYVLVISPLRALMRDQVENARRRGFAADRIDASVSGKKKKLIMMAAKMGALDILYVTPERFMDEDFNKLIIEAPPALVVLDEAHTLARWGPSFRPSYLHAAKIIADIRSADGWPPVALFTATAPQDVVENSLAAIGVYTSSTVNVSLNEETEYVFPREGALVFRGPIVRSELVFDVITAPDGPSRVDQAAHVIRELAQWSSSFKEPWVGVVYTGFVKRTRKEWENADQLADLLAEKTGLSTISYHGQLSSRERRLRENMIYEASMGKRDPLVVVATKAFGMGVDIPNIRWILHFTASDSIEDYYQEVGRAGRDGKEARIVTFYNPIDFEERIRMARAQRTTPSAVAVMYNTIYMVWNAIRQRTGGSPMIILPTNAIHPDPLGLKAVSMLQRLGYLDYWSVRTTLTGYKFKRDEDPSDYLPWYMDLGNGIVVGPQENLSGIAEKLPLRIQRCTSPINGHKPLILKVGPLTISTDKCKDYIVVETSSVQTMIVNLSLDMDHKPLEYFPPADYHYVVTTMWSEEEKVEALHNLLESAIEASKKSKDLTNQVLRSGLEAYFSGSHLTTPSDPPASLLGKRSACPTIAECLDDIVKMMIRATEWIGERGVTLAVQNEEWADAIIRRYTSITGKPFKGTWKGSYARIVNASRRSWVHLMDYGFLIAVVRGSPRPSVLIDRLRGYPYHALFIYNKA